MLVCLLRFSVVRGGGKGTRGLGFIVVIGAWEEGGKQRLSISILLRAGTVSVCLFRVLVLFFFFFFRGGRRRTGGEDALQLQHHSEMEHPKSFPGRGVLSVALHTMSKSSLHSIAPRAISVIYQFIPHYVDASPSSRLSPTVKPRPPGKEMTSPHRKAPAHHAQRPWRAHSSSDVGCSRRRPREKTTLRIAYPPPFRSLPPPSNADDRSSAAASLASRSHAIWR